ncbi:DUF4123 domain-containing protein [Marinobacter sp.]|uniref:DUF4123 domain-containing protein n=1 Tax=Marinobacter sp. TaxID=50741 RepID=UPI003562B89C
MNQAHHPLDRNPFDVIKWPGDAEVVLILDPCAIPDLGQKIFEWSRHVRGADCLYVNTPWEPVQDVAPWAVWLSGPYDPVLQHFVQYGAVREAGYVVMTSLPAPEFGHWLRQRIQIEPAPGTMELVRIGHPALAAEIVGNHLIRTETGGAVTKMILPDRTRASWIYQAPANEVHADDSAGTITLSHRLPEAFRQFNVRRANLMIWDTLDDQARTELGGPELPDAWPELCRLSEQAAAEGATGIRSRMQYISHWCSSTRSTKQYANCM